MSISLADGFSGDYPWKWHHVDFLCWKIVALIISNHKIWLFTRQWGDQKDEAKNLTKNGSSFWSIVKCVSGRSELQSEFAAANGEFTIRSNGPESHGWTNGYFSLLIRMMIFGFSSLVRSSFASDCPRLRWFCQKYWYAPFIFPHFTGEMITTHGLLEQPAF